MKNIFIVVSLIFLFTSCENPLYDLLARTAADPFFDIPQADSFSTAETVYLTWQEDEGADTYVLKKAIDDGKKDFIEIYRGTKLAYVDTDLVTEQLYLYRLDKIRGNKYFEGEKTALGISTIVTNDEHEPNNERAQATLLTFKSNANLYAYEAEDGSFLEDNDWYKIKIAPRKKANIVISENGLSSGATATSFSVLQPSIGIIEPIQNVPFTLENTTLEEQIIYFKVYANTALNGIKTYSVSFPLESN